MQFPIDNILIVPSKNDFMNEIGAFVTVYTQIPTSNLKTFHVYVILSIDKLKMMFTR